jgi:hypothetical protein
VGKNYPTDKILKNFADARGNGRLKKSYLASSFGLGYPHKRKTLMTGDADEAGAF